MRYYKWQSDSGQYVIEKFVGDVSSSVIELSDQYLVEPNSTKKINVISDIRGATFTTVNLHQVRDLSSNFARQIPPNCTVMYALVINPNQKEDQEKIMEYAKGLQAIKVEVKIHDVTKAAYEWLNIPISISREMERKVQEWQQRRDED